MAIIGTPTNHNLSDGTSARQNMENHGYPALSVESHENIGWGYGGSDDRVFAAWQASAGHNANLLDPEMRAIGLAKRYTANSVWGTYWTQDFGAIVLENDAAQLCDAPQPTPTPTVDPNVTPPPTATPKQCDKPRFAQRHPDKCPTPTPVV
jgi:hypothetical protein